MHKDLLKIRLAYSLYGPDLEQCRLGRIAVMAPLHDRNQAVLNHTKLLCWYE